MSGWLKPETPPQIGDGGLQVWRIWLGDPACSRQEVERFLGRAYETLSGEERDRAARMRAGSPREEFVAGRGCLRRLLGVATERQPHELDFQTGEHGKPELGGGHAVQFNVAHSRGMVLIALARGGSVGVDVEFIEARSELIEVARTAFHPQDVAKIEDGGLAEFYRCWTRKEAVAKADGRGLTNTLTEHEVGSEGVMAMGRYFVHELDVGAGYAAALACEQAGAAQLLDSNLAGVQFEMR